MCMSLYVYIYIYIYMCIYIYIYIYITGISPELDHNVDRVSNRSTLKRGDKHNSAFPQRACPIRAPPFGRRCLSNATCYITLHYTIVHYITLQYNTLHYSTLHYITLPCYITLH